MLIEHLIFPHTEIEYIQRYVHYCTYNFYKKRSCNFCLISHCLLKLLSLLHQPPNHLEFVLSYVHVMYIPHVILNAFRLITIEVLHFHAVILFKQQLIDFLLL